MKRLFTLLLLLFCGVVATAGQKPDSRLEALRRYILEKDYPEVFGESNYKTRIENVLDIDIDNDGAKEMVVLYFPHYRQSPPIVIYKVSASMEIKKVAEGLAPGPLQSLSGDYLDSHNLGMSADLTIDGKNLGVGETVAIFEKSGMKGVVAYDGFFHVDNRKGSTSFIDMRGIQVPGKTDTCEEFEFSHVRQISAGHLQDDATRNYLAAWVGDEIWVYLIRGISNEGLLEKSHWILKSPKDFHGFASGGTLAYKTESGMVALTLK